MAAVDRDGGPGDEVGVVRDQEQHGAGDVLCAAEPADRDAADDFLQHRLRHRAHHVGVDIARRHGIHGDAVARALLRQRLGEAVDAGFRRGIVDLAVLAGLAVDRADIDDAPEPARAHAGEGGVAEVEAGAEIGVEHRLPALRRHPLQRAVARDPGIVHQDVDGAELPLDLRDARLAGREIAHVPLVDVDAGDGAEALGRLVARMVVRGHPAAVVLQRLGYGAADTPCSARHQCDPRHALSPGSASRRRGPYPRRARAPHMRRRRPVFKVTMSKNAEPGGHERYSEGGPAAPLRGVWPVAVLHGAPCLPILPHVTPRGVAGHGRAPRALAARMRCGPVSSRHHARRTRRALGRRLDICRGETPWLTPMLSPS